MNKPNVNKVVEDDNITYIADEEIIDDSLCPKCMEKISDDVEFCSCGFYVKAAKRAGAFSLVFFIIVFLTVAGLVITHSNLLPSIGTKVADKFSEEKFVSSATPIIQIQDHLKDSGLMHKIRDMYQEPKKRESLVVVIKPEYWSAMKASEKKYILSTIEGLWKNFNQDSKEAPSVRFANPS